MQSFNNFQPSLMNYFSMILVFILVACGQNQRTTSSNETTQYHFVSVLNQPIPEFNVETTDTLLFLFEIAGDYHIQSNEPLDEYLIPTKLTLSESISDIGLAQNPIYPSTKEFMLGGTDLLLVFDEILIIKVPIMITSKPGEYQVAGTLKYQACDESSCYYPRKVEFKQAVRISG